MNAYLKIPVGNGHIDGEIGFKKATAQANKRHLQRTWVDGGGKRISVGLQGHTGKLFTDGL